ncbi:espin-like protein [Hyperolius riggenbachi]|uniref:espin-like protein n=1 Tax=Hyperolius riggenbachi TaxID=752182 RepID=UPI0035A264AF
MTEPPKQAVIPERRLGSYITKAKITALFSNSKSLSGETSGKLQDVLQLTERSRLSQCIQKARITGIFLHSGDRMEEDNVSESGYSMDLDALVPTCDEKGRTIPEWKRQVMVRRLQAHLDEETKQGEWRYSRTKSALLGPYGELVTEEELRAFDGQMEELRRRRECQQYEKQLKRLVRQLQAILPTPMVNVSINSELLEQKEDPEWSMCMTNVIQSMSNILSTTNGTSESNVVVKARRNRSSSPTPLKELLQCGVSVKRLRGQFEKQQPRGRSPVRSLKAKRKEEDTSDSGISSEDSSSHRASPIPSRSLRKERIILLFLSHWKKTAYSIHAAVRKTESISSQGSVASKTHYHSHNFSGLPGTSQTIHNKRTAECSNSQTDKKEPKGEFKPLRLNIERNRLRSQDNDKGSEELRNGHDGGQHEASPRMGNIFEQLLKQKSTVQRLIGSWKSVPINATQSSPKTPTVSQAPEKIISTTHTQTPINHDSLSLDLFMLGYFRLLEQDLPEEERRMRHLLCFEVFDQLGHHGWPIVRDFHCTVLQEIATGHRTWADGFEDIKVRFFGTGTGQPPNQRLQEIKQSQPAENNDICQCIDRSFTFWKEKEAELFGGDS